MKTFLDLYDHNTKPSSAHREDADLSEHIPAAYPVRYIAYYLPQFHADPVNDGAWGRGFTEWTNTTKAVPRYEGHYQPRLPGDLGFYNLDSVEAIRRQARLAARAGIYGFCIHNYWFSGVKVLQKPLEIILANPDLDLRFCLNWANGSWTKKWNGLDGEVLVEQLYRPGDAALYAQYLLTAVKDPRYITVGGRPLVMFYQPSAVANAAEIVATWRRVFESDGVRDPFIVMPQAFGDLDPRKYGCDAAVGFPPHPRGWEIRDDRASLRLFDPDFAGQAVSYETLIRAEVAYRPTDFTFLPGVCPSWDNEARRPGAGFGFHGSHPALYGRWLDRATQYAMSARPEPERMVFINAWNEWAEGAYLEPDRHHGFAALVETRRAFDRAGAPDASRHAAGRADVQSGLPAGRFSTRATAFNFLGNAPRRIARRLMRRRPGPAAERPDPPDRAPPRG